ncbi:hypothetical protein [Streptomyces sp. TRM75563]|uniref:hypothetical protein n=1 Tax=Streptomyces sp. TRM75563 TaxID=2817418 RepID=UPI001F617BD2|nr:hypothetical protein [Streptomyces sp. TRM75563]MCI4045862.1 hypothetical protein [Streptomyces sp. TRM75563]
MVKKFRVAAACFTVVALAAGCGDNAGPQDVARKGLTSSDPNGIPSLPSTPQRGLLKGKSLPLEDYMQTYEQTVTITNAVGALQTECMAKYGFDFQPPPAGRTPPPNDNDVNIERRYGISDRALAKDHGYGIVERGQQAGAEMPELSAAAALVMSGRSGKGGDAAQLSHQGKEIPEGGCSGWSVRKVGADAIDMALASKLSYESLAESQEAPAVRAALNEWSDCLKAEGYEAATPFDAMDLAKTDEAEISVALADIDCKESTNLLGIWLAEETKIQRSQIEQNQLELREAKEKNAAAVKAAEKALRN